MFKAKCSKCGTEFETKPGELNSTAYLGKVSMLYGSGGYLPKCPECENYRDNQLIDSNGLLSEALRI
ncbi:MAG TPA: hypothetical protein VMW13_05585 [Dehalococcoidales bacterium]|nr:hypothetical protein [Dehalococcoidales bacterium]